MSASPKRPTLHIRLLGDFQVVRGERPVTTINTPRLQSLFAFLLLHREAPQLRQHVAFLLWPDSEEAQAHTNLRHLLHSLRQALPDAGHYLRIDRQALQWKAEAPLSLDVSAFQRALAQADDAEQAGDHDASRASLEEAVALYGGDLLPSCYDDWIIPEREALSRAFSGALERLASLLENQRDYGAAIRYARQLVDRDELNEIAYRRLMRLHALNGDRTSALRAYHTCATTLRRELGVDPDALTRELYERLLGTGERPAPPAVPTEAIWPLVGRREEWEQLQQAWRTASAGHPHLVLITGENGIGKTRLADEIVAWAERQGIATATARCYAAEEELPFAPVVAWLRARALPTLEQVWRIELVRLLPELHREWPDVPTGAELRGPWQRQRLFEALARALVQRSQPALYLVDGLHWCDQHTLNWLPYLLRFDARARLLIVGTYRLEAREVDEHLAALLRRLRRDSQVTMIDLPRLNQDETVALASHVAGRHIDPLLASCLYRETEGNPLFIVETVRAGLPSEVSIAASGDLVCIPRPLPSRMQDALEARLAQLSPSAYELAQVGATIGRDFNSAVLARASDLEEDALVRALDELWQQNIVCEHGLDSYDFSHDRLRETAYAGLSAARKRFLHKRVARALEAVHADNLDSVSASIAAHYDRAGLSDQAAVYTQKAATFAQRVGSSQGEGANHPI